MPEDRPEVSGSAYTVALALMEKVMFAERNAGVDRDREYFIALYKECIAAVLSEG